MPTPLKGGSTVFFAPRQPLEVAAAACVAPWDELVDELPRSTKTELVSLPGFVLSSFGPMVATAARACLGVPGAAENRVGAEGSRTAIVLGTLFGDAASTDEDLKRRVTGRTHNPLLFYQSATTSVFGVINREYGITGGIHCISDQCGLGSAILEAVDLLLEDEGLDQVLAIGVELAGNDRTRWIIQRLAGEVEAPALPRGDTAVGLLVRRAREEARAGSHREVEVAAGSTDLSACGWLEELVHLCVAFDARSHTPHPGVIVGAPVYEATAKAVAAH